MADMQGWVGQSGERGTMDIIWSCGTTLAVCCWLMVHLNIPAETDTFFTLFCRKSRWLFLALMAPELVMLFACGQWASARRSVADMTNAGYSQWTMEHAFYADSGGFMLSSLDYVPFPISAKQVHYLVTRGYLQMPAISQREIWDKSKADKFAKAIASFQALWLVTQVIGRLVQQLPITLLELSTVALVSCAGAASFFWFHKPLNVQTSTALTLSIPIAQVMLHAGKGAVDASEDTPLDFIEPKTYTSPQLPLAHLWSIQERPLPRLPNDRDSRLHSPWILIALAIPTASFSLIHLLGWNFDFPSHTELLMWRYTCLSMDIVLGLGCLAEAISIAADGYTTTGLTNLGSYKLKWPNNILFFVPAFLYVSARMIVLVEIVISMRLLPAGCFKVVSWSDLLPHV